MSRSINCNFQNKVHIIRKRSMFKRPSTILLIVHLIIASDAYPSFDPRVASSQNLAKLENAGKHADPSQRSPIISGENSKTVPKVVPIAKKAQLMNSKAVLPKAQLAGYGRKQQKNWRGGNGRRDDFTENTDDSRKIRRKELVERVMSLEERMSKLDLASGNASSQFPSNEKISGIQQNDSNYYGNKQKTTQLAEQMKELEKKFQQLLSEVNKTNKNHQMAAKLNDKTVLPTSSDEHLRQKVTELEAKNEDQDEIIAVLRVAKTRLNSDIELLKSYNKNQTRRITQLENIVQQRNGNSSAAV